MTEILDGLTWTRLSIKGATSHNPLLHISDSDWTLPPAALSRLDIYIKI